MGAKIDLIDNSQFGEDTIYDRAITQGKTFVRDILWAGDYSLWTPRATIRDNYKELSGAILATFAFNTPVYPVVVDAVNYTAFRIFLTALQTEGLLMTTFQGKPSNLKIGKAYVWDFEIESGTGEVLGLDSGWVQVKPEVT